MKSQMTYPNRHQKGLTLIESLVALVILALGVLGLAGVQTRVLVESRTTNSRAIAIGLIDDLNNRMLLNRDAAVGVPISPGFANAIDSAYATAGWLVPPVAATTATPDPLDCRATGTPVVCTPTQLAQNDLMAWRRAVAAAFPSGQVNVFNSTRDRRQLGIAIAWPANERALANATDDAIAAAPLTVTATSRGGGVVCPNTFICHIVYAQP